MHAAVDEGLTFFDNCWDYHDGGAEEIMGRALADGRRDKVFLMTKNCERDYAGSMKCLDDSLRRLRTDRIDLWQFHEIIYDNDPDWVFEKGGLKAALEARKAGQGSLHRLHRPQGSPHPPGDAGEAIRRGTRVSFPVNVARPALPELPEAGPARLPEEQGGRDRHEGFRRRQRHRRAGRAHSEEAYRYALSQPIASQVVGMTTIEQLRENVALARGFKPLSAVEQAALADKVKPFASDGRFEQFKSTQNFDGPVHRRQHGFSV